jgi:DNA-binding transcriptional ArsR family regulator
MRGVDPSTIDWTAVYEALSDDRRRDLLDTLHRTSDRATVDELADRFLHEWEDVDTGKPRDALEIRLRHVHLPRLQHAGLAEWDREADEVTLTALGAELPVEFLHPSRIGETETVATTSENVGD